MSVEQPPTSHGYKGMDVLERAPRGYFRSESFGAPRVHKPDDYSEWMIDCMKSAPMHKEGCQSYVLTDLGTEQMVPPGPDIFLEPMYPGPTKHAVDALIDAYSLLSRNLHLHAMDTASFAQRSARLKSFREQLLLIWRDNINNTAATSAEKTEKASQEMMRTLLVEIRGDFETLGFCDCVDFETSSPDLLGREHFIPIDMTRVEPTMAEGVFGGGRIFSWMDPAARAEAIMRHQTAAVAIWRNRVLAGKPISNFAFPRDAVLAYYESSPIEPHKPTGPSDPMLVELSPMYGNPSSTANVTQLDPITIGSLLCPKKHEGKILYVKVLTLPVVMGLGIKFVTEDAEGLCLPLMIEYPLPLPAMHYPFDFLKEMYPVGTILGIKEPYVRFAPFPGRPELCVTIPTDIIEPAFGDARVEAIMGSIAAGKTALEYKDMGNHALTEANNPQLAFIYYSRGISRAGGDAASTLILLMNRTQAALRSDRPGAAWRDCNRVDDLLRTTKLTLTEAQKSRLEARRKLAGQALKLVGYAGHSNADADWVGPIEIRDIPGKGIGTVATRKIKVGETIRIETPLVEVEGDPNVPYSFIFFRDTLEEGAAKTTNTWLATAKLIHMIIDDPRNLNRVAPLHPRLDGIDPFPNAVLDREIEQQAKLDAQDIAEKIMKNSGGGNLQRRSKFRFDFLGRELSGLILKPDYSCLNHSCLPNTMGAEVRGHTARTMVTRDVEAGEEVTTTYLPDGLTYGLRSQVLKSNWGFDCSCQLCEIDRQDDYATRLLLYLRWQKMPKSDSKVLADFRRELEKTYAPGRIIRPELALVLDAMTQNRGANHEIVFTLGKEALAAAGVQLCTAEELASRGRAIRGLQRGVLNDMPIIMLVKRVKDAAKALGPRRVRPNFLKAWAETPDWIIKTFLSHRRQGSQSATAAKSPSIAAKAPLKSGGGLTVDMSEWKKKLDDPNFDYNKWCDENIDPEMDLRKYKKEKIINGEKVVTFDVSGVPAFEEMFKAFGASGRSGGMKFSVAGDKVKIGS